MSGELWLAEGFTQYYGPLTLQRAGLVDVASTAPTFDRLIEARRPSPGRLVRSAEEMSRMAPFIDGGRTIDRTNWSNDRHLVLSVRRRDRAGARPDAARPERRPRLARRLHARDVAHVRQAGRQPRRLRRSSVHDRRRRGDAGGGQRRSRRSRATSSPATSRATTSPTTRACSRAPASPCASATPGRAWLGDLRLESRGGARVAVARGADLADLRRRPRSGRRAAARSTASASTAQDDRVRGPARHKPGDTCRSCSSIAPAPSKTAQRRRSPRIRTSRSCRSSSAAPLTRGAESVPRPLAGSEVDGRSLACSSSTRCSASPTSRAAARAGRAPASRRTSSSSSRPAAAPDPAASKRGWPASSSRR